MATWITLHNAVGARCRQARGHVHAPRRLLEGSTSFTCRDAKACGLNPVLCNVSRSVCALVIPFHANYSVVKELLSHHDDFWRRIRLTVAAIISVFASNRVDMRSRKSRWPSTPASHGANPVLAGRNNLSRHGDFSLMISWPATSLLGLFFWLAT